MLQWSTRCPTEAGIAQCPFNRLRLQPVLVHTSSTVEHSGWFPRRFFLILSFAILVHICFCTTKKYLCRSDALHGHRDPDNPVFFVPISIRPEKLDNELSMMIVGQCGKVAELHSVRSVAYAARMLPQVRLIPFLISSVLPNPSSFLSTY